MKTPRYIFSEPISRAEALRRMAAAITVGTLGFSACGTNSESTPLTVGTAEGKYNYSSYAAYHVKNAAEGTEESGKGASANALALINALYEYVNYAKTYNANK